MDIKKHRDQAIELLKDSYDLHIHTGPSPFKREMDGFQLVRLASEYKMAGVLIKSHYELTASRAELINNNSNAYTKAYGGMALNWPVGGLNPYAVENAMKTGAIIVWMPTRDAKNSLVFGDMPGDFFKRPGISIYDEEGKVRSEIYEIFEIVKKYGSYLATGHLSPEESIQLCKLGCSEKVKMILTHPEFERTTIDADTQKELSKLGVLIEKNWYNIAEGAVTPGQMVQNIKVVGPESIYIASDRGQKGAELPVESMLRFIELLLDYGFTESKINLMTKSNPERIVSRQ